MYERFITLKSQKKKTTPFCFPCGKAALLGQGTPDATQVHAASQTSLSLRRRLPASRGQGTWPEIG